MKLISKADVVLALGTRLGPFGTLPQHGLDYWPKNAKIIQIDADAADAGAGERDDGRHLRRCEGGRGGADRSPAGSRWRSSEQGSASGRHAPKKRHGRPSSTDGRMKRTRGRSKWPRARATCTRARCCASSSGRCRTTRWSPPTSATSARCRTVPALQSPAKHVRGDELRQLRLRVSDDHRRQGRRARPSGDRLRRRRRVGHELRRAPTCVRENIAVTAVVFNNGQWGAEKKNQVDYYDNRFVGVNLDKQPSWAAVAKAMGAEGVRIDKLSDVGPALAAATKAQSDRQDDRAGNDGHSRARRPFPARCTGLAGASSGQIQIDCREALTMRPEFVIREGRIEPE